MFKFFKNIPYILQLKQYFEVSGTEKKYKRDIKVSITIEDWTVQQVIYQLYKDQNQITQYIYKRRQEV